ncbi:Amino-terminal enhancer of split, partial [Ophiophagus hannah]
MVGYLSHPPHTHPPQKILFQASSHLPQQLKFTTSDSCDRIKDEFQLLQAQYHSLKLECDKLASEKSEMQRHYVMHQQQVLGAIERAKQVTAPELNSIIRVCDALFVRTDGRGGVLGIYNH